MTCLFILIMLILQHINCQYKFYNYSNYIKQWRLLTTQNSDLIQIDVNQGYYEIPKTECIQNCEYPVFQFKRNLTGWQPTIFFVSGFHGNEPLGPHILLQFAKKVNRGHIVFFPLVNPSGYSHDTRQQYPSKIDTNRDFPYNNQECMKTATSRIIDKIFRKWKIDLSLSIHQGMQQLAWNWGTKLHSNQASQNQIIYNQIGSGIIKQLKTGYFGMNSIKIGQMNNVIYPAEGTFQDWAYAGSWDTMNPTKNCRNYKFDSYPQDMHSGLVYIFESAPHNIKQSDLQSELEINNKQKHSDLNQKDYISRGIRILQSFVDVANPRLQITPTSKQIQFKVFGCNSGKMFITIQDRIFKPQFKGSLNAQFAPYLLKFQQIKFVNKQSFNISYQITCDVGWRNIGKTSFSRGRQYQGIQTLTIDLSLIVQQDSQFSYMALTLVLLFVLFFVILYSYLCNKRKKKNIQFQNPHQIIDEQFSARTSQNSSTIQPTISKEVKEQYQPKTHNINQSSYSLKQSIVPQDKVQNKQ